jgi:small subunit ribosomal protein S8
MQEIIANAMNCMMNAKKAGKTNCIVPSSKFLVEILKLFKKEGYVGDFKEENGSVIIEFGSINECRAIKPRFYATVGELDKYIRRFLPARDFGILIISTSKGLMTHKDALEKNVGGSLIAYCY